MEKQINVDIYRHIDYDGSNNVGTVGEKNATKLHFNIPDELNGYTKELIFNNEIGSFVYSLIGNTFDIPNEITTETDLSVQLCLKGENDTVEWKSEVCNLELNESLDESGENAIETAVNLRLLSVKNDIATALTHSDDISDLPTTDYSGMTINQLYTQIADRVVINADKTQKLTEYTDIMDIVKEMKKFPNIIYWGTGVVPYMPTYSVTESIATINNAMNEDVTEFGCDFSNAAINGIETFLMGKTNLEKIKITGMRYVNSVSHWFWNCSMLEELEVQGLESPVNFLSFCQTCGSLKKVIGELPIANMTDYIFFGCFELEDFRVTPNLINNNLSISYLTNLSKETILSVINGLSDSVSKKLVVAGGIKSRMDAWSAKYNETTGLWVDCDTAESGMETYNTIVTVYKLWQLG